MRISSEVAQSLLYLADFVVWELHVSVEIEFTDSRPHFRGYRTTQITDEVELLLFSVTLNVLLLTLVM